MNNQEVIDTLGEIRTLMERSAKVLTLNGLSALFVGILACIGAYVAHLVLDGSTATSLAVNTPARLTFIITLAGTLLALCLATVVGMSWYKARRNGQTLKLDRPTRNLLWSFFLPLFVGGVICVAFILQQRYGLTSTIMLVFYGMALVNSSRYTYSSNRWLGYAFLLLGLTDCFIEGHALVFWVIGFGLFHIIYGICFYLKHNRPRRAKLS